MRFSMTLMFWATMLCFISYSALAEYFRMKLPDNATYSCYFFDPSLPKSVILLANLTGFFAFHTYSGNRDTSGICLGSWS